MRRISATILLSLTALPMSSFAAATLDDVVNAINNVYNLVASNFSTAMTAVNNLIYEDDPNLPATAAGNSTQSTASSSVHTATTNAVIPIIQQSLTQKNKTPEMQLSYIQASDTPPPASSTNIFSEPTPPSPGQGDADFNMGSLIAPTAYDQNGQYTADYFNKFMAYINTPLTTINWNSLSTSQKNDVLGDANGQKYRTTLRSLVAARSVAMDNLYNIYSERLPVANLGTQTGIPNTQDASPLQVQEYVATRRTNSQDWYNDMAQASPATVQREQLFVLAEMERQLYQLHRDNERIIATLSAIELLDTASTKYNIQMLEPAVKSVLNMPVANTPQLPVMPITTPAPTNSTQGVTAP
jgi:hypothetical protein